MATQFLIENLLAASEVNLLAGPSGAGKTTWLLQMIESMKKEEPFFSYPTKPLPKVFYVALDRPETQFESKLEAMELPPDFIPYKSLVYDLNTLNTKNIWLQIPTESEWIILDGIEFIMRGRSIDSAAVAGFLSTFMRQCRDTGRTITLINHSPKQSSTNRYLNPRQRVMGSAAWAAMSSITTIIEKDNPDDPSDTNRTVWTCSNVCKEKKFELMMDEMGRLVPRQLGIMTEKATQAILAIFMGGPGLLPYSILIQAAMDTGASEATARRALDWLIKSGLVLKVIGYYQLAPKN